MSWFSRLFRKDPNSVPGAKPLKTKAVGWRQKKIGQKWYEITFVLTNNDRPLRSFNVDIKGYSRKQAELLAQEKLSIKLVSSKEIRRANKHS